MFEEFFRFLIFYFYKKIWNIEKMIGSLKSAGGNNEI